MATGTPGHRTVAVDIDAGRIRAVKQRTTTP